MCQWVRCCRRSLVLALVLVTRAVMAQFAPGFSDPGCDDDVLALTLYHGDLIAGGSFTTAGYGPAQRIARWDGGAWHPLASGVEGTQVYSDGSGNQVLIEPRVQALAVFNDELIVGGSFTTAGGQQIPTIARWDGAAWTALGDGITESVTVQFYGETYTFPPLVTSLCVRDGKLYVGGLFQDAGGIQVDHVASWDGQSWQPLHWGVRGGYPTRVFALLAVPDGVVVGGDFAFADTIQVKNAAHWDGNSWTAYNPLGMNGPVWALATCEDTLVAGGSFTTAAGLPASHIARWVGGAWEAMDQGVPNPVRVVIPYGGDLFAGGFRWLGQNWVNEIQANGAVCTAAVYRGRLVIGGEFLNIAGRTSRHIGAWPSEDTPVYLTYFMAERRGRTARLSWEITGDENAPGFHVWRQEGGSERYRLTEQPVLDGPVYEYVDSTAPLGEAEYWLQKLERDGSTTWLGQARLRPAAGLPDAPVLAQNHPNPFNPSTSLTFWLPSAGWARLSIYDTRGRQVALLLDSWLAAGSHAATWNGRADPDRGGAAAASGVYLARLVTATSLQARKITLAR